MKQADFYQLLENGVVQCQLCPHSCLIADGERGICHVRSNRSGVLYSELFEKVSSLGVDPIEKKPLFHFYHGTQILSVGTVGCNLKCNFCQNYRISQANNFRPATKTYTASEIVEMARRTPNNIGIAFTYNEPVISYEYILNIAELAGNYGLKRVLVTNGYINQKPLTKLLPVIDALNVDLKAFTDTFYRGVTQARLEPVKKSLKQISESGKHLEITNLVIPGLNDNYTDFEKMVKWIATETGERTVLHISRYFPNYKLSVSATPLSTLFDLFEIAKANLVFVYLGNAVNNIHESTYCDNCGTKVISREGYRAEVIGLDHNGNCQHCRQHILDYC